MVEKIIDEPSRTLYEYLLHPGETTESCSLDKISLKTPVSKFRKGENSRLHLNIPLTSAIMQSVSNHNLAINLALQGGISFIYQSQSIEQQAEMVRKVKSFKAGFVESDTNLGPNATLGEAMALTKKTGHSTIAITDNGERSGKLLGILTDKDYWAGIDDSHSKVMDFMTPVKDLVTGKEGITLEDAAKILQKNKKGSLPILDSNGRLVYLVFRKDYEANKEFPIQLIDNNMRLCVGAGLNTRDYLKRGEALINAGADVFCFDSSDGHSTYQKKSIVEIKEKYPDSIIGAGNVVTRQAFDYLVDAGADFIKVGIGGGSICITREQKGIGMGQATAIQNVVKARNKYYAESGIYVPVCADGGIVQDYHITNALAFGADFVMMGRYFARFEESPAPVHMVDGQKLKAYWGEGTNRARNWQRYHDEGSKMLFEEGVDGFVPSAGRLKESVADTINKIKSAMCSCGCPTISDLHQKAILQRVSEATLKENKAHDIIQLGKSGLSYSNEMW
jgi:IMP dehydrogenase